MRFALIAALLLSIAASSAQAGLPNCTSEAEKQAMLVRGLQSYLMIAGVACNQGDAYNKFVTANQRDLSAHGNVLKSYFQRVYGSRAQRQQDDFITGIANVWSQVHLQNMTNYCKSTWEMMWQVQKHPQTMADLAKGVAAQPSVTATMCNGVAAAAPVRTAATRAPATRSR